jgi:uncharacterized protein YebE (UPF0316 family)
MIKYLIIFLAGILETAIYTGFLIALEKRNFIAPLLMTIYMIIYLSIISTAIKDINTFWMIIVYTISCGTGVLIRMKLEQKITHKNCKLKIK